MTCCSQRTDDGESLGQLCAPCYEYCEGWFAFKSMCWNNNTSNVIDLEEEDSLATNGLHEEITIQSEDYDTNGFETLSNSGPLELDDDHRIENMDTAWECPCDCEVTGKSYETFRDHLRDNHLNGNVNWWSLTGLWSILITIPLTFSATNVPSAISGSLHPCCSIAMYTGCTWASWIARTARRGCPHSPP